MNILEESDCVLLHGEGRLGVMKRDDYVLATGLLPEISLDCSEYRVRDEILSTLPIANNKLCDIDRCAFEFLDVSGN